MENFARLYKYERRELLEIESIHATEIINMIDSEKIMNSFVNYITNLDLRQMIRSSRKLSN